MSGLKRYSGRMVNSDPTPLLFADSYNMMPRISRGTLRRGIQSWIKLQEETSESDWREGLPA
jgi:hypothetical protein